MRNTNLHPKVCFVYDHALTRYGGAEHVLKAMSEVFPTAPLFTSVHDPKTALWTKGMSVHTSFLQKIPFLYRQHRLMVGTMPIAFESLNLNGFDVIISVTSSHAKGVLTKPNQLHICYLLTPPRYLYTHQETYLSSSPWLRLPIVSQTVRLLTRYLRWWDEAAATRPDLMIPISQLVKRRAETYYLRPIADVLYPPLPQLNPPKPLSKLPLSGYLLTISRLVAYKQIDLAIHACHQLKKVLIVAGKGEEFSRLSKLYPDESYIRPHGQNLEDCLRAATYRDQQLIFLGSVTSQESAQLFSDAQALLMPGIEDFGLTALESLAYGKPVLVHAESGVAEVLQEGQQAVFYRPTELKKEISELGSAIGQLDQIQAVPGSLQRHARRFNNKTFTSQLKKIVYDEWTNHRHAVRAPTY
jgi:glycosyltransferase involved in cell wall biosynthesis